MSEINLKLLTVGQIRESYEFDCLLSNDQIFCPAILRNELFQLEDARVGRVENLLVKFNFPGCAHWTPTRLHDTPVIDALQQADLVRSHLESVPCHLKTTLESNDYSSFCCVFTWLFIATYPLGIFSAIVEVKLSPGVDTANC